MQITVHISDFYNICDFLNNDKFRLLRTVIDRNRVVYLIKTEENLECYYREHTTKILLYRHKKEVKLQLKYILLIKKELSAGIDLTSYEVENTI